MFGTDSPKKTLATQFLYMTDDEEAMEVSGELTWYDARYNHPTRTEWRLYYPTNDVTVNAAAGDALFICMKSDGTLLEIIARKDSVIENQEFLLFANSNEKGQCKIVQCSYNILYFLGYEKKELIRKPIEILMPTIFIEGHKKMLEERIKRMISNQSS